MAKGSQSSEALDLSAVPTAYLEAYPSPAFVLVIPVVPVPPRTRPGLVSRDTDVTVRHHDDASPLSGPSRRRTNPVVWANEKWLQLTEGRSLDECVDRTAQDRLQAWAEGEDSLGIPEDAVFRLEMHSRQIVLNLSRTIVPLSPPFGTHAFCIITSQRERVESPASEYLSPAVRSSVGTSDRVSYSGEHRVSQSTGMRTSFSTDVGDSVSGAASPFYTSSGESYFPLKSATGRSKSKKSIRPTGNPTSTHQQMHAAAQECWRMTEQFDWASTSLGPRSGWSDAVDPILSIAFQSKTQDCIWLGEELRLIYNLPYSAIVDHPRAFGQPGREVWTAIWEYIEPLIEQVWQGTPIYRDNDLLSFHRFGPDGNFLERYHTWRYIPIIGNEGKVLGIFNQSIETTKQVLAERRMATVRELSEHMLVARSTKEYYSSVGEVLSQNAYDAPFALCYSVQQRETENTQVTVDVKLETSVGVPDNHPSAPGGFTLSLPARNRSAFGPNADRMSSPTLSAISALSSGSGRIYHSAEGSSWPISKALASRQCVIVDDCRDLIKGFPLRQWDKLPSAAIVVPICSDSSIDTPEAVLVLGLNSRRPFDADYDNWVHVIRAHLASSLTSVKAYEVESKRLEDNARMEKAKAAWFRGAAHDLRSPLALISGPLDDALDTVLNSDQRNSLVTAKRNVDRLMRLVNALMDFSRLEAGRVEGRFVPIDLGSFVSELAAVFRPAVERMEIQYIVEVAPSDKLVFIDPTLFETVVSNLIGNALKYTESGSITVRLTYGDFAEVAVIDTGVGIPKDELSSVSEWFHRATTAIHSGTQGTGLGLALAKELLHLHGGELLVSSQTAAESGGGHGSVFTARIPLTPKVITTAPDTSASFGAYGKVVANEAMRWVRDPDIDSMTDSTSDSHAGPASRLSEGLMFEKSDVIILADDNIDMRDYIKQIFSPYCKVIEAKNGEDALAIATENPPNLIISDLMMPKMNGIELLAAIRQDERTKIVPFVMISAVTGDDARVDALIMGAEDYLPKPFKPKELLARVHLHMQVGKKRAKLEKLYAEREVEIALLSDYCPSGIMRANAEGIITYVNKAWRTAANMTPHEEPNSWVEHVDEETLKRMLALWAEFVRGDQKELRLEWKWSSGRTMAGMFVRLDLISPGMTGILGCLNDITYEEEKIFEAERRRLEAEESRHQQELLIDLTSHEIRTPVSAILQCSSLVKENLVALTDHLKWAGAAGFKPTKELLADLDEDIEALESIYQCGLVQERIAGDVLSLARIQLDMLSLHDIEMDVRKEAKKVLAVFASEAKMKKIDLALEFGETFDVTKVFGVKTDPVRLGQIVTNLISNAIRFTASSDIRRIAVRYDVSFLPPLDDTCALPSSIGMPAVVPVAEDTPLWLFVSVRDTGPGLGPKELALLFKRFSQGNKMIHTRYGGSGLGLFICRKITELLGGRIEVQSQIGLGSVFRFFIKTRAIASPSRVSSYIESTTSTGLTSPALTPPSSVTSVSDIVTTASPPPEGVADLHILIVEDNLINQTVLKRQIVKAGLTCDVANNGLEAVNLIRETDRQAKRGGPGRKKPYNVVLMDLEMPVMDGLTAIKEIRVAEEAGTLERNMVIALTGNARQGQIDQALAAGMDDVVIKPYVLSNLLKKIKAMSMKKIELLEKAK